MTTSEPAPGERSIDDLAARARGGDAACFAALVERLRGPLTRFIERRVARPADAEDAVQETFLRAYNSLDRYDPSRRFSTWLFAIGKNVAASHRDRERRREAREQEAAPPVPAAGPEDGAEIWQLARRVLADDPYRALWLRYARDLSVSEVARELGRSVVATKVMLFRARKKLSEEESR